MKTAESKFRESVAFIDSLGLSPADKETVKACAVVLSPYIERLERGIVTTQGKTGQEAIRLMGFTLAHLLKVYELHMD